MKSKKHLGIAVTLGMGLYGLLQISKPDTAITINPSATNSPSSTSERIQFEGITSKERISLCETAQADNQEKTDFPRNLEARLLEHDGNGIMPFTELLHQKLKGHSREELENGITLEDGTKALYVSIEKDGTIFHDVVFYTESSFAHNQYLPNINYQNVLIQFEEKEGSIKKIIIKPNFRQNLGYNVGLYDREEFWGTKLLREYEGRDAFAHGISINTNQFGKLEGTIDSYGIKNKRELLNETTSKLHSRQLTSNEIGQIAKNGEKILQLLDYK